MNSGVGELEVKTEASDGRTRGDWGTRENQEGDQQRSPRHGPG